MWLLSANNSCRFLPLKNSIISYLCLQSAFCIFQYFKVIVLATEDNCVFALIAFVSSVCSSATFQVFVTFSVVFFFFLITSDNFPFS